jgi:hypothetical protein
MPDDRNLTDRQRRLLVAGGVLDVILRALALIDLLRRPKEQVRGPKGLWVAALSIMNSLGVVPATYFIAGRRKPESAD